mmetsp:Transcript_31438/g.36681  ORF Transcript_31438/g.36681 Transcript_31438/m.36681 type:complete len:326 (-) Transcript_31438:309-1286(-)
MSELPYALDVLPDTALQFVLTRGDGKATDPKSEGSARCVMTLKHPGRTNNHLAFKVKTTQPRRYLVRPNQGIVAPNSSETVTILLVDKDKQMLLQSFDRLGQSALDHSKDKFLVQSCTVDKEFADLYSSKKAELAEISNDAQEVSKVGKEIAESLTGMWNAASSGDEVSIYNKKLQVRHVVGAASESSTSQAKSRAVANAPEKPDLEKMTQEQMYAEVSTLRRKYDELVTFSVNLTAERDILNNTLEQTKRDLNRQMALATANQRKANDATPTTQSASSSGGPSIVTILFVGMLFFLVGIKATKMEVIGFLFDVPVLGDVLRGEL